MKRLSILVAILFAVGCKSSPKSAEPKETPKKEEGGAKSTELDSARADLAKKKAELQSMDYTLQSIQDDRKNTMPQPESEEKTRHLAELAKLEMETRPQRDARAQEVAALEQKVKSLEASGGGAQNTQNPPTESEADRALREAEEAAKKQEAAEESRRKTDAATSEAEKKRVAEAQKMDEERRRKMDEEAKAMPKVNPITGKDKIYEEEYAPELLRIRTELQRYKTW